MVVQNRLRTMVSQNHIGDLKWEELFRQVDTKDFFRHDLDELTWFFTENLCLPKPSNLVYWRLEDVMAAMDATEWSVLRAPLVGILQRIVKYVQELHRKECGLWWPASTSTW